METQPDSDNSHGDSNTPLLTSDPVRKLDASDLRLREGEEIQTEILYSPSEIKEVSDDDPVLSQVRSLLGDGYAGVIFVGPPGTGKTWYADRISRRLVDYENHPERRRLVQFHPSYQYEDFVEGYVPDREDGGFTLEPKHLLEMCQVADNTDGLCVLVIDEISRSDPGRVFGEALTYIEMERREQNFHLASGSEVSIPRNLVILATMNPADRGADQVDAAFERRFAKISREPDAESLREILEENELEEALREPLIKFFHFLKNHDNRHARVGHAYFIHAEDKASLRRLWEHQLKFHLRRAFQLSEHDMSTAESHWEDIFPDEESAASESNGEQ